MHIKLLLKILLPVLIVLGTSTSYAFDYKSCMAVKFEQGDLDAGMREILIQVTQLDNAGLSEDVNFEALAYLSAAVTAYATGFITARTILLAAKSPFKEDEQTVMGAFQNMSKGYLMSLERLSETVNKNIAFVKSQSVRDDLKALVIKNKNQLRRLSPCAN